MHHVEGIAMMPRYIVYCNGICHSIPSSAAWAAAASLRCYCITVAWY